MQRSDVEIAQRQVCHDGFFKLHRLTLRHRLFNGGWSQWLQRELFMRPPAVGVLLYDPVLCQVVLVQQFRNGLLDDPRSPWMLEVVAGMVGPGESPEQVARREASEEVNCQVSALLPIMNYYCSPGGSNERFSLFCGKVDSSTVVHGEVHGLASEHEDIKTQVLPLDEALQRLARGEIDNAMTIIALQWLQLQRAEVERQWLNP